LLAGSLVAMSQLEEGVTCAGKIRKADAQINWSDSTDVIHRQIRAYNSWPVAHTLLNGELLRCWQGVIVSNEGTGKRGAIISASADGIDVQTGAGILRLTEIQLSGRRRSSAAELARNRQCIGEVLGQ
jgi:methionyl-tRNA formyltransferase